MKSNPTETASRIIAVRRMELAMASISLRWIRSTRPPIGIANSNQGTMVSAAMVEIQNGSLVRVVASRGPADLRRPSTTLLAALEDQSRLNAGLNLLALFFSIFCFRIFIVIHSLAF